MVIRTIASLLQDKHFKETKFLYAMLFSDDVSFLSKKEPGYGADPAVYAVISESTGRSCSAVKSIGQHIRWMMTTQPGSMHVTGVFKDIPKTRTSIHISFLFRSITAERCAILV